MGNLYSSIQVGYTIHLREVYEDKVIYPVQWANLEYMCGDLKIAALIVEIKLWYTKYCCLFLRVTVTQEIYTASMTTLISILIKF